MTDYRTIERGSSVYIPANSQTIIGKVLPADLALARVIELSDRCFNLQCGPVRRLNWRTKYFESVNGSKGNI